MNKCIKHWLLFAMVLITTGGLSAQKPAVQLKKQSVICGADRHEVLLDRLEGLSVGLVGNKSSLTKGQHVLDFLLENNIEVKRVFCPEHGFRQNAEAGAYIDDHLDSVTGLPVISLYGKYRKPDPATFEDLDVILFDLQDVGVRFYTYISTLHYVMQTAAECGVQVVVADRPNPNGFLIDGPVRKSEFKSFVGMHPIPVAHGMTIGEYAMMINGEGWLGADLMCRLEVISCLNYDHYTEYIVPVAPSPNLPNQTAVYLYPSLCFFEGTNVSVGRGTKVPFQVFGHPDLPGDFVFRPEPIAGASLNPKHKNELCYGYDLRRAGVKEVLENPVLHLEWVIQAYEELGKPSDFFTPYFDTLAGTDELRLDIIKGLSRKEIRQKWQDGLDEFKDLRNRYLLYN